MFDETYLHYVRNDTDCDRLILMCDVKRPLNPLGAVFNHFYQVVTRASVVPNTPEDRRGLANGYCRARARVRPKQGTEVDEPAAVPRHQVGGEYPAVVGTARVARGRGAAARSTRLKACRGMDGCAIRCPSLNRKVLQGKRLKPSPIGSRGKAL